VAACYQQAEAGAGPDRQLLLYDIDPAKTPQNTVGRLPRCSVSGPMALGSASPHPGVSSTWPLPLDMQHRHERRLWRNAYG
jgi:hypothetical protein